MDFAQPLFDKGKGAQMRKVYFALFTCCMTQAGRGLFCWWKRLSDV